ncbi:MAG: TPM domain-containing protein [Acidobacteriota bacterium]
MRIWRVVAWVLALVGGVSAWAEKAATLPPPTGYVDDYAGVLTDSGKMQMEALCKELHEKTKAQVFVVTVKSLEGEAIEPFANDLFHRWKIGEKKTDRGALLLFAVADHRYRIEVGYGLEGILNDAKVGDIGREMVPGLTAGEYDSAAETGLRGVVQVIADDAKVQLDGLQAAPAEDAAPQPVESAPEVSVESQHPWVKWLVPLMFLGPFVGILLIILLVKRGMRRPGRDGWSTGPGGIGSSGSSLGSDSSSSSFSDDSSSSSDDSFSGGNGGDSGGGGASGSW